jgi:hypothetical protein
MRCEVTDRPILVRLNAEFLARSPDGDGNRVLENARGLCPWVNEEDGPGNANVGELEGLLDCKPRLFIERFKVAPVLEAAGSSRKWSFRRGNSSLPAGKGDQASIPKAVDEVDRARARRIGSERGCCVRKLLQVLAGGCGNSHSR